MASILDEDSPPLFCERLDWADITPLEQYENISPIAPIFYSEECKKIVVDQSSVLNDMRL